MRFSFTILCLILAFILRAQRDYPIIWGMLERSSGSLIEILPKSSTDFYALRWQGSATFGNYRLSEHENLGMLQQKRIKTVTQNGFATFETAFYFGDKLMVLLSDRNNSEMMLYAQLYDEMLDTEGTAELLASYTNSRIGSTPNFKIVQSANRKYLGVIWEIPGRRASSDVYGYKVLDANRMTVQTGEYVVPFDGNLSTINEHHITNTGAYILSITEHNRQNDRMFSRNFDNYKALHLFKIQDNELKEFSIDVEGLRIDDMQLSSSESNYLTLTGLYGRGVRNGIEGIVTIKIDTELDSVLSKGVVRFSSEIAMERWNGNDWNQNNINNPNWNNRGMMNNQTFNNNYYDYLLRDLFVLEDGSIVGSMEQYYVYRRVNYDNRTGMTSNITYYYYDDIIAFKVSPDGNLAWQQRIPKSQVSMNDGGPFSSYSSFTDGKSINFIFNDSQRNYNEEGLFNLENRRVFPFNLSKRNNVGAIVQVDVNSGSFVRKTLFSRKEIGSIVVPKLFKINWVTKEILLYSILGTRERFGLLTYK
jgi:hypothetical protein